MVLIKPTILLVDDDPRFVYLLQRYATSSGCQLQVAGTDTTLITMAQRDRPALIILSLPYATQMCSAGLQHVRTLQATRSIPLVTCSALEEHEQAQELHADACLWQPVLYHDFVQTLTDLRVLAASQRSSL